MAGALIISLVSFTLIATTGLITYEILRLLWAFLPRMNLRPRLRVLAVIAVIFGLHTINIWIYAFGYLLIEKFTYFGRLAGNVGAPDFTYQSIIERLYYSASTYASLGIGDIHPTRDLCLLTSAEVLNGLLLIGWTISFTYLTMEKFWALPHRSRHE